MGGGGGVDSDAAPGKIPLVSVFIEASRNLKSTFQKTEDAKKNLKTIGSCTESTDLILRP
jgi:hypothetical protein